MSRNGSRDKCFERPAFAFACRKVDRGIDRSRDGHQDQDQRHERRQRKRGIGRTGSSRQHNRLHRDRQRFGRSQLGESFDGKRFVHRAKAFLHDPPHCATVDRVRPKDDFTAKRFALAAPQETDSDIGISGLHHTHDVRVSLRVFRPVQRQDRVFWRSGWLLNFGEFSTLTLCDQNVTVTEQPSKQFGVLRVLQSNPILDLRFLR